MKVVMTHTAHTCTKETVMEKIVVVYDISDECTYSFTEVVPLEYSSVEAFICDFADWMNECIQKVAGTASAPRGVFKVGSYEFECDNFRHEKSKPFGDRSKDRKWNIDLPEIYTLEEWFMNNNVTNEK